MNLKMAENDSEGGRVGSREMDDGSTIIHSRSELTVAWIRHRGLSRSGWILEMFGVRSLGCQIAQACVRERQEAKWSSSFRAVITRHVCYNDSRYHHKLCSSGEHLMLKHHSHKQLHERVDGAETRLSTL